MIAALHTIEFQRALIVILAISNLFSMALAASAIMFTNADRLRELARKNQGLRHGG